MAGLVKKDNISFRQRLLSFSVVLVCACIVLAMRFGFLPAGFRVNGSMIPVSDLFIILCAGLCGHRYGLGMFLLIFITEVVFRGDDIIQLFPLFLYLIEALSASALSEGKWFQSKKMTILAGIILELQIGGTLYLVFTIIYAYSEDGIWKCLLCSLPETAVVIFFLYAYFQYVPDSIKGSFGIGRAYIENQDIKSAKKDRTARFITLLSLAEGIIAGIVSVVPGGIRGS